MGLVRLNTTISNSVASEFSEKLLSMVVGQDHVVKDLVSSYVRREAQLSDSTRPIFSMLMLGPTGTGKTRTAEALAIALHGDSRALTKIDCAEYSAGHEVAKLTGSAPGYLGHKETSPMLSQQSISKYCTDKPKTSIILFDELEKAGPALFNILLGILDKASLSLGDNSRVDFTNSFILCTSNLGAARMIKYIEDRTREFRRFELKFDSSGHTYKEIEDIGKEAVCSKFAPEFVNRFDKVATFRPLFEDELWKILDLELTTGFDLVANNYGVVFEVEEDTKRFLLQKGTNLLYGARELRRVIARFVTDPVSKLVLSQQIGNGDLVQIALDPQSEIEPLVFSRVEGEGMTLTAGKSP